MSYVFQPPIFAVRPMQPTPTYTTSWSFVPQQQQQQQPQVLVPVSAVSAVVPLSTPLQVLAPVSRQHLLPAEGAAAKEEGKAAEAEGPAKETHLRIRVVFYGHARQNGRNNDNDANGGDDDAAGGGLWCAAAELAYPLSTSSNNNAEFPLPTRDTVLVDLKAWATRQGLDGSAVKPEAARLYLTSGGQERGPPGLVLVPGAGPVAPADAVRTVELAGGMAADEFDEALGGVQRKGYGVFLAVNLG